MEKSLGKNAILSVIKQACSVLFPFISFVYCSRMLGKEGIGAYSFSQSIVSYLLLISVLGITNYSIRDGAIIRNNMKKLHKFINEVFSINVIMTIIAYTIMIILLMCNQKNDRYKEVIIIQSLQIILTTMGADWINSIFEDYYYLTVRYIVVQVMALVLLLIFVRGTEDLYIYTFISVMSNAGGNLFNFYYLKKKRLRPRFTYKMNLRIHLVPILVLFANSVASVIYLNSDITMIGLMLDDGATGIYTVSTKIYTMTKAMINAFIMVAVPRFSNYLAENRYERYRHTLSKIADCLVIVTIPSMVGMIFEASKILDFVAGPMYLSGVKVIRILSLAIFFATFSCFFSYTILLPNRLEKYFLLSTSIAAMANISLNVVLIPRMGINGAAITTLIAEVSVFIITFICSVKTVRFRINGYSFATVVVATSGLAVVCFIIDRLEMSNTIQLFLDMFLGGFVYFIILFFMKNPIVRNIGLEIFKIIQERLNSSER